MLIPVIHTKTTILPKIILFLVLSGITLLSLILLSASGMMINNYEALNFVLIAILLSQFLFATYFLLAKKYENLGKIIIENDLLSVRTGKETLQFSLKKMVDTRIFFNCQIGKRKKGILGNSRFETGNYILFQYAGKTRIYELLLRDKSQAEELLKSISKYLPDQQLQVFDK